VSHIKRSRAGGIRRPVRIFFTVIKGAPTARQPIRRWPDRAQLSAGAIGGMRDWQTEPHHGPRAGEPWATRRLWGRRPAAPCRAEALRARRRTPVSWPAPAGRRPLAQAVTLPR
jgi:hypothetical protein